MAGFIGPRLLWIQTAGWRPPSEAIGSTCRDRAFQGTVGRVCPGVAILVSAGVRSAPRARTPISISLRRKISRLAWHRGSHQVAFPVRPSLPVLQASRPRTAITDWAQTLTASLLPQRAIADRSRRTIREIPCPLPEPAIDAHWTPGHRLSSINRIEVMGRIHFSSRHTVSEISQEINFLLQNMKLWFHSDQSSCVFMMLIVFLTITSPFFSFLSVYYQDS